MKGFYMGSAKYRQLFMIQQSLVPTKVNPKQPLGSTMKEFLLTPQGWSFKKNEE